MPPEHLHLLRSINNRRNSYPSLSVPFVCFVIRSLKYSVFRLGSVSRSSFLLYVVRTLGLEFLFPALVLALCSPLSSVSVSLLFGPFVVVVRMFFAPFNLQLTASLFASPLLSCCQVRRV